MSAIFTITITITITIAITGTDGRDGPHPGLLSFPSDAILGRDGNVIIGTSGGFAFRPAFGILNTKRGGVKLGQFFSAA